MLSRTERMAWWEFTGSTHDVYHFGAEKRLDWSYLFSLLFSLVYSWSDYVCDSSSAKNILAYQCH